MLLMKFDKNKCKLLVSENTTFSSPPISEFRDTEKYHEKHLTR